MQTTQTQYLPRLDHLRFYAAALVVVFHFFHTHQGDMKANNPLLSLVDEGHTGIGLFMVISGYIFTVIAGEDKVLYWPFLRNRLIRIYPLFVFAVLLSLYISTYNDGRNYGAGEFLSWLIPFRSSTVPFSQYFVQLWTIWVEFQFYLVFPFLHRFAQRYGNRYLWALLAFFVLLRLILFINAGSVRFLAYETIFGRMDAFLCGMLLARLVHSPWWKSAPDKGLRSPLHLLIAGAAVIFLLHGFSKIAGFTELNHPIWIIWPTVEGLMWAWFLLAYVHCSWNIPGWLERAIASLGVLSFSMYVMHNFLIAAFNKLIGVIAFTGNPIRDAALTGVLAVIPAVLLLSMASYFLIERPFLSFRGSYLLKNKESSR